MLKYISFYLILVINKRYVLLKLFYSFKLVYFSLLHLSSVAEKNAGSKRILDRSCTLPLESDNIFNSLNSLANSKDKKLAPLFRSKDTDLSYDSGPRSGNWFDGLLRCLKPVWTVLGKSTSHELKEGKKNHLIPLIYIFNYFKMMYKIHVTVTD